MASRKAQTTRQRYTLVAVSIALLVTVVLAVYTMIQSRTADHQRDVALSRLLAAQARKTSSEPLGHLDLALLLSVAANRIYPTLEVRDSLFAALSETNRVKRFIRTSDGDTLLSIALRPDGSTIAPGISTGESPRGIPTHSKSRGQRNVKGGIDTLSFSPDGAILASAGPAPSRVKLTPVAGFTTEATAAWANSHLAVGCSVTSDGLACFAGVSAAGCLHNPVIAGGRKPDDLPEFRWVNTVLGNIKTSLSGAYHAFDFSKYADRYLAAIANRFNRRFQFSTLPQRLLVAAVSTGPRPEAWLRLAEDHC